jgi:hypothetical protein
MPFILKQTPAASYITPTASREASPMSLLMSAALGLVDGAASRVLDFQNEQIKNNE